MFSLSNFSGSVDEIQSRLQPFVSENEVIKSLELLEELNLLSRNKEGQLQASQQTLTTGDEVSSVAVTQFHKETIQLGKDSIDRFSSSQKLSLSSTYGSLGDIETAENEKQIQANSVYRSECNSAIYEMSCDSSEMTSSFNPSDPTDYNTVDLIMDINAAWAKFIFSSYID
jgi:uncharacterized protein (TIGR02147 family)